MWRATSSSTTGGGRRATSATCAPSPTERNLRAVADEPTAEADPWDAHLDAAVAHDVLGRLGAHHRSALTLRYLDGLSVPEVAEQLGRTLHATEALLVRARLAFRRAYEGSDDA